MPEIEDYSSQTFKNKFDQIRAGIKFIYFCDRLRCILTDKHATFDRQFRTCSFFSLFWRRELGTLACAVTISILLSFWLDGKFTRTRQLSVDHCSNLVLSLRVHNVCSYRSNLKHTIAPTSTFILSNLDAST